MQTQVIVEGKILTHEEAAAAAVAKSLQLHSLQVTWTISLKITSSEQNLEEPGRSGTTS